MRLVVILGMVVLVAACNSATTSGFKVSLRAPHPEIVSAPEPVRTGETAMKFHVEKNDCRSVAGWSDCELGSIRHEMRSGLLFGEKWVSYSIYLPRDFNDLARIRAGSGIHRGIVLGQFHRGGTSVGWLFQMDGTGRYVASNYLMGHGQMPHENIATKDELYGRWLDVLIHAKFTSDIDGFVRIYVNGESAPRYSYDGVTYGKGGSTYFKFGIYQWHVNQTYEGDPSNTVYWDNVGVHGNCNDAASEVFSLIVPQLMRTKAQLHETLFLDRVNMTTVGFARLRWPAMPSHSMSVSLAFSLPKPVRLIFRHRNR